MNANRQFLQACKLEDQASNLLDKIAELRLANYSNMSFDWDRFKRLYHASFSRYNRRALARQSAFESYLKSESQFISSAVEREAFHNSGDTCAAPHAAAPVLAECRKEQKAGLFVANAGQGSNTPLSPFYVWPDYDVYECSVAWKSDDYLVVYASDEHDALEIFKQFERLAMGVSYGQA